jgi:hypothetical protein
MKDLVDFGAVAVAVPTFQSAAIVAALAERGLVDPIKVAAWVDTFAAGAANDQSPEIRREIVSALRDFATLLRSMASRPATAGAGRQ